MRTEDAPELVEQGRGEDPLISVSPYQMARK